MFMRWVLGKMKESGARATFTEIVVSKAYEFVNKPDPLVLLSTSVVPEKMQAGVGTPTTPMTPISSSRRHSRSSSATAWDILVQLQKSVAKAIRLG